MVHQILKLVKDLRLPHFGGAIVYPNISMLDGMQQHLVLGQFEQQLIVSSSARFFDTVQNDELVELKLRDGAATAGIVAVLIRKAIKEGLNIISVSSYSQEHILLPVSQLAATRDVFIKMGFRSIIR